LPERLALAWLLGAGFLPVFVSLVGPLLGASLVRIIVPAAALGAWFAMRRRFSATPLPMALTPLHGALVAILAVQAVFVAIWTSKTILGWDALLIWDAKARLIFSGSGAMPHAYFSSTAFEWSHPDYPFGFSALAAWVHLCAGHVDQGWVRI